jgi:hypothetical protein
MRFATLERPVVIAIRIADCSGGVIMPVCWLCPAGLRKNPLIAAAFSSIYLDTVSYVSTRTFVPASYNICSGGGRAYRYARLHLLGAQMGRTSRDPKP